jgi:16S rRNA (adenine1518-N6/adenine1519-N6)-dimethyltransferase
LPGIPANLARVEELLAEAFSHRRKMLRQSLKSVPANILEGLGISPELRAEDISPSDWLRIADSA